MATYDLELRNLKKVFDNGNVAVNNFNLNIEPGEFVAFLGPSGCGKTTTLRMIGGFEEPTSGDILIKGSKVNDIPPNRRKTNMVFQNYALFPHMNVAENIEYGLKLNGTDAATRKKKMKDILELVQMHEYAERNVHELSGGQRQRIAIARSLVVEPDILLLDEPLGALDANLRARVQVELKALQNRMGITFIFVTHSQSEAMALADKIVVMNEGEIEQIGTPEEIYGLPRTKFVAKFVGKNNIIDGKIGSKQADQIKLRTAYGIFSAATSKDLPAESGATLVIRADQAQIVKGTDTEREPGWNYIKGRLKGEEIIGSIITYIVEVENGVHFTVEQHESVSDFDLKLNSEVLLRWNADDAIIL
ncbi:ABC transporter ATP-binding protein [Ferviditalea candida]|uniref:ABC transporter ATP-binding protein n=1 Tax=Ferviditalea candida TaxID=3108399 RepID=A0ABU5ZH15_9BACL|nr:ABC transporter ATP-binding protein [Paenibacillaceae bacterium T2]